MTALLGELLPRVEGAARLTGAAGHHDRPHVLGLEDPESGVGEVGGQVGDLGLEAQVGLVGAVALHRLGVGDPRERRGHLVADQQPDRGDQVLGQRDDVVLVDEAHLDVELGELGLPVGAEVLVAVTARDLEVALQAGHHQQLLEQLGALRQGVPAARLQPRRHQEVACALGGGPGQRRGLDLDEVALDQQVASDLVDPAAQPERVGGRGPAEVEVAVLQPGLLAHGDPLVDLERQRARGVEHLDRRRGDLDVPGRQLGVGVALGPQLDHPGDGEAELVAQVVRTGRLQDLVPDDDLGDTTGVPQIDERHPAMVSTPAHPAG